MTSNSTTEAPFIPPLIGISEAERDKYLLIGTFLSVLIIFGVLVAVMHKKCRETMVRTKGWIIAKTVRHRPNTNRSMVRTTRSVEMTFRHPQSPIFSKEINPPLLFHLGNSSESSTASTKRLKRSSETSNECDSGIAIITSGQNSRNNLYAYENDSFEKDVNDNVMCEHVSLSRVSSSSLVRVLPPENPHLQNQPQSVNNQDKSTRSHPKLRRSSTVIDKMNLLQGYLPSLRDDDYTVVTVSDESEPDLKSVSPSNLKTGEYFDKGDISDSSSRKRHYSDYDNPAVYLRHKMLSKSLSDIRKQSSDELSVSDYMLPPLKSLKTTNIDGANQTSHVVVAEIHTPLKFRRTEQHYKKSLTPKQRALKCRSYPMKSFDKESQELYNRVIREKIQELIHSDSSASSVKSDQTYVRKAGQGHKKKLKKKIPKPQVRT